MHHESTNASASADAAIGKMVAASENVFAGGHYRVSCVGPREELRDEYNRLGAELDAFILAGNLIESARIGSLRESMVEEKWEDGIENLVTTLGKNLLLDTLLAGSAYTTVGPYLGLINTNASAAAVGDTMASHAGWLEVGGANAPTYTSPRKTISFSAASSGSKASSGTYTFAITSSGTVGGCFLVTGTGALSTIDNTAGTLYSAGAFSGGSKTVANGDSLTVTYTATA